MWPAVWSCHSNPNPSSENRIKENKLKKKIKWERKNRKMLSSLSLFLTHGIHMVHSWTTHGH